VTYKRVVVKAVDGISKGAEDPPAISRYAGLITNRSFGTYMRSVIFARYFTHLRQLINKDDLLISRKKFFLKRIPVRYSFIFYTCDY
jgi:hypothetical protein